MNIKLYILLVFAFFTACTTYDLPEDIELDPVFEMSSVLDGESIKIKAGQNNYYIKPEFLVDMDGIVKYKSTFINHDPNSSHIGKFEFIFNGESLNSSQPRTGDYSFYENDYSATSRIKYSAIASGGPGPFKFGWRYHSPVTFYGSKEFFVDKDSILKYGGEMNLEINNSSTRINYLKKALPAVNDFNADFSFVSDGQYVDFQESINGNNGPYHTVWMTRNDSVFDGKLPVNTVLNYNTIKLKVYDSFNDSVTMIKYISNLDPAQLLSGSFDKVEIPGSLPYFFSKAEIKYTARNGDIFSTASDSNPPGNKITIVSSTPYLNDSDGNKTMKLNVTYEAMLYSKSNQSKKFTGNAVIAVVIK